MGRRCRCPTVSPAGRTCPGPAAGRRSTSTSSPARAWRISRVSITATPSTPRSWPQVNADRLTRSGLARPGTRLDIPPLDSPAFQRMLEPVHSDHATRDPEPVPQLPTRGPAFRTTQQTREIKVEAGDTLSELAATHLGNGGRWGRAAQGQPRPARVAPGPAGGDDPAPARWRGCRCFFRVDRRHRFANSRGDATGSVGPDVHRRGGRQPSRGSPSGSWARASGGTSCWRPMRTC